jgi:C-terminal processing protease CtpA/Prc
LAITTTRVRFFDAIESALRILAVTDAIIIDLRNSRGGSPAVANFIISHFTGPDATLSLIVYDRVRNTTTPRHTMREVPGPRRPDVPLFVLTDDVTRSAAEDVTFVLQNMRRATVIGSRTAGAGRNNAGVSLGHGITGSVSLTRVMEPGTRREWERVGVVPDIATDPDSALAVAHREAIRHAMANAQGNARNQLELTLQAVEAKYAAVARSERQLRASADLATYVGTYEGA